MSQTVPIVFVHQGDSWYLPYVIRQALSINSNTHVTLLGDVMTNANVDGLSLIPIENLKNDLSNRFKQVYKHISTNHQDYEIFCWLRWFYLLEYMESQNINNAFYLDSDVLIYTSPQKILKLYPESINGCAFLIPQQSHSSYYWCAGGHISYWTRSILRKFCLFTIDSFCQQDLWDMYRQKWNWHLNNKVAGGICDMTTLYLFSQQYSDDVTNFLLEDRDGGFDMNFNTSNNFLLNEYAMKNGHKKINLKNDKIIGFKNSSVIAFHNIHFQGWAKRFIPKYYQGDAFPETRKHYLERLYYNILSPLKIKLKPILVKMKFILKNLRKPKTILKNLPESKK